MLAPLPDSPDFPSTQLMVGPPFPPMAGALYTCAISGQ
jgi:hypothetical protein